MEFYHDWTNLGLDLPQRPGIYAPNQRAKEPVVTSYISLVIDELQKQQVRLEDRGSAYYLLHTDAA
jgi:hypothetical protein